MVNKSSGYVKLLGYSRNSSDIPRMRNIMTASSIAMTKDERESLKSAMDFRALSVETRRETDKFALQDAAVEKFKKNYSIARKKLAGKINKNRALMELRYELQKRRRMGANPDLRGDNAKEEKASITQGSFNEVELRY